MNIILIGKFKGNPICRKYDCSNHYLVTLLILTTIVTALVGGGYWYGKKQSNISELAKLENDISQQKSLIHNAKETAESEFDALAMRLGKMQANVIRVNALGQRLVKLAKLDAKEFNFKNQPAYGGPAESESNTNKSLDSVDFHKIMNTLQQQLSSREQQLSILQDLLLDRQIKKESKPIGLPVKNGWASSYFGRRTDPFTGKVAMHKGVDFAGKRGTKIVSVAKGVVSRADQSAGYGKMVEINHGNGYRTRYGHNSKLLVKVGKIIKKGEVIALMGSTGRSTGSHVHFEVLKDKKQINPAKYIASQK